MDLRKQLIYRFLSGGAKPWYQAGGAPKPVGYYKAIGAASYAASKVNLVNPGVNDLTCSSGDMAWTTENGWLGNDSRYLKTGIIPTGSYTVFAYFSDLGKVGSSGLFGANSSGTGMYIYFSDREFTYAANYKTTANMVYLPAYNDGILCIAGNKVYYNGIEVGTVATGYDGTGELVLMAVFSNGTSPAILKIKAALVYSSILSATQVALITAQMRLNTSMALSVTTPSRNQVIQRVGTTGTISISGTLYGSSIARTIEASWGGAAYADIATDVTGAFTGTLTNQAQGQGDLIIRIKGTTVSETIKWLGIGDVFIVAGQSNASGRGTSDYLYSHATLKTGCFGNNYSWKNLGAAQQFDSPSGQIDMVSSDPLAKGNAWTRMATSYLADRSIPCAFVPCAMGGTSITAWQPGANHQDRTTLYGSMVYRALQTGCIAVLWWQGETDAAAGMSAADYNTNLDTLANAIQTDLGVKLIPCLLHNIVGAATPQAVTQANWEAINAGITTAWGDNANVLTGPDLTALVAEDAAHMHLTGDVTLASAGAAWFAAVKLAFGWT